VEVRVGLNALIIAVTRDQPRVMTIPYTERAALPFGDLDSEGDRTLELALRRWVRQQTELELGYVEQLYSFGDRARDRVPGVRMISIAYLALVREEAISPKVAASWRNVYDFLPWEDCRKGPLNALNKQVAGALNVGEMGLRSQITFGLEGAPWDGNRALERYELLYELGLVQESASGAPHGTESVWGEGMALDHRRMLATALARIRGKLRYRPVIFEMLPEEFTLLQLQKAVEALSGVAVHKQNFRRLVEQGGLVEGTGQLTRSIGRPAELFRFRREVLRERPAPGVGLPRQI